MARNKLHETEDQLVARYIGGLRVQIQETVNLFDPISVSAAHQRALLIEKQLGRRSSGGLLTNTGGNTEKVDHATSGSGPSHVQVVVVWVNVFFLMYPRRVGRLVVV